MEPPGPGNATGRRLPPKPAPPSGHSGLGPPLNRVNITLPTPVPGANPDHARTGPGQADGSVVPSPAPNTVASSAGTTGSSWS